MRSDLRIVKSHRDPAGRPPPSDLYAERVVLSDCLLQPANIALARSLLHPSDFWSEVHQHICEALWAVDDAGAPIDILSVAGWLKDRQRWNRETSEALGDIADKTPQVANVESHAKRVKEKSRLRSAIHLLHHRLAEAYDDVGDVQVWLERSAGDFAEVACDFTGDGAVSAKQAATDAAERRREAEERIKSGNGLSTHLESLDRYTGGLHRGEVTYVTAESGGGKSAFCGHMMLMVAGSVDREGQARKAGLMFSLEMPREDVVDRWACAIASVDYLRVRNHETTPADETALTAALDAISRLPLYIDDRGNRGQLTFDAIRAEVLRQKSLIERAGQRLDLVIVDYIQLIAWESEGGRDKNKYQALDAIGKKLKLLAQRANVAILVPAQLNSKGEIRDCPALAHHAQNWFDVRPTDDVAVEEVAGTDVEVKEVAIRIKKQRHGRKNVDAMCYFRGSFLRFSDTPAARGAL